MDTFVASFLLVTVTLLLAICYCLSGSRAVRALFVGVLCAAVALVLLEWLVLGFSHVSWEFYPVLGVALAVVWVRWKDEVGVASALRA